MAALVMTLAAGPVNGPDWTRRPWRVTVMVLMSKSLERRERCQVAPVQQLGDAERRKELCIFNSL